MSFGDFIIFGCFSFVLFYFVSFCFCFANKRKHNSFNKLKHKETLCNWSPRGSHISHVCYFLLIYFFLQGWFLPWVWKQVSACPTLHMPFFIKRSYFFPQIKFLKYQGRAMKGMDWVISQPLEQLAVIEYWVLSISTEVEWTHWN